MTVTLRPLFGKERQVDLEDAKMKTMLGYYQYNAEENVYEHTEFMRERVEAYRKEARENKIAE